MTTRLYYTDAEQRTFHAVVVACEPVDGRYEVRLDRTAFYPSSGGQPFDVGQRCPSSVVDVIDGEDGEIVHVVTDALERGMSVRGAVDWTRRFDHMQQHSGQHILSAVFDHIGATTESFHLGTETCSIDLSREVTPAQIGRAEHDANAVLWDDRPVVVRFATAAEARDLPLRKASAREGDLRLVEIPECDLSACGGTHVRSTGVVGQIALTASERFKGGSRVSFVCGGRALTSHQHLRDAAVAAGRILSVGIDQLGGAIERLQAESRDRTKALAAAQLELVGYRAREWRAAVETIGGRRCVIRHDSSADGAMLKALAQAVAAEPGLLVVLVGSGLPVPVVVARSSDMDVDAGGLLRTMTSALGGRGGGRSELAQGGVAADADRVVAFVRQALMT